MRRVGALNESLRLIIIYYMFKYTFGKQNNFARVTSEPKRLIFARAEFLRFFGASNESIRLIIMYYLFKYTFGSKTALLDSHRS